MKEEDPAVNRKEDRKLGNKKKEMRDGVVCFLFKSLAGCVHRQRDQSGKKNRKERNREAYRTFCHRPQENRIRWKEKRKKRKKRGRKSRRAVMSCTALAA